MNKNVKASVINTSLNPPDNKMKHFAHAYGCLTFIDKPTRKDIESIKKFYKPILEAEIGYEITKC